MKLRAPGADELHECFGVTRRLTFGKAVLLGEGKI